MLTEFQPLDYAEGQTVKTPNGSLVIKSAGSEDEGYYLCRATNGIGANLSKVVFLAVNGTYCAHVKLSFFGVIKVMYSIFPSITHTLYITRTPYFSVFTNLLYRYRTPYV
jgi:hypothetical protein